ncbi:hypothetical protein [Aureimonas populi]|uniref:Uncharacterized protein n=1 Tax=Aureimonas populi TaxID=1701758 RepID=A0ABW5CJK3_9HYPH|nr:hypothetical protein [Aureimonas populi]
MTAEEGVQPRKLSEGAREKIKLRATYVNGIANAFIVAAVLTIPLSMLSDMLHPASGVPFSALCLFVSLRPHWLAQGALDGLDR